MLQLLWASLLAAGVVSLSEYLYILLTCGPFWMDPARFLTSWLVYIVPSWIGAAFLTAALSLIAPFRKRLSGDPSRRFRLTFSLTWIFGVVLLTAFVVTDFDTPGDFWVLPLLGFAVGTPATFLLARIQRRGRSALYSGGWTVLLLIVIGAGVYLLSDVYYAGKVKSRTISFNGRVPNISLIVLDTARGDHFSCYDYPYNTTPNMDRIAREGLLCYNAYSASHWTPPGHISIFTGKYPSQHGNEGAPYTPDDLVTLTEVLREGGYYGVAIYNNPLAGRSINLTQGFDVEVGVYRHSWVLPAWMRLRDKLIYKDSGSKATFPIAVRVAEWVKEKGGHLFLYLNLVEPHADYVIHEPFFSEFTRDLDIASIPNLPEVQALCNYLEKVVLDTAAFARYDKNSYRYLSAAYDSEIAYTDNYFGVYSDKLRASGLLDETLLVITADHGEFLGEHYTRGHPGVLYDPTLRIPLILRYPALIKPDLVTDYTSNVDIFPTILTLTGYEQWIPDDVQGFDLFRKNLLADREIMSERVYEDGGGFVLYQDDYKVMLAVGEKFLRKFPLDTLMFNIKEDPGEMVNIFPENRDLGLQMIEDLTRWNARIAVHPTEKIRINRETKANLRALGYVN